MIAARPGTAAIKGHPIHPQLIPFPIAFLSTALATDIAYAVASNPRWAEASTWLLGAGVVTGLLAAVFGVTDFATIPAERQLTIAWVHAIGNRTAVVLAIVDWWLHEHQSYTHVLPWRLVLSAIFVGILSITSWAEDRMVYRFDIGVAGPPEASPRRPPGIGL